jgi:hypothetical protein
MESLIVSAGVSPGFLDTKSIPRPTPVFGPKSFSVRNQALDMKDNSTVQANIQFSVSDHVPRAFAITSKVVTTVQLTTVGGAVPTLAALPPYITNQLVLLRPNPFQSCMSSAAITVNSQNLTTDMTNHYALQSRTMGHGEKHHNNRFAGTPGHFWATDNDLPDAKSYRQAGESPIGDIESCLRSSIVTLDAGTGVFTITSVFYVTEWLSMAPFLPLAQAWETPAIVALNYLKFSFNMKDLAGMIRFPYKILNNQQRPTVNLVTHDTTLQFFMVAEETIFVGLQNTVDHDIIGYQNTIGVGNPVLAAGVISRCQTQSITLIAQPAKIALMIMPKPPIEFNNIRGSGCPFPPMGNIVKVTVTYGSRGQLMQEFSQQNLLALSIRNGFTGHLQADYGGANRAGSVAEDWIAYRGGYPIILDPTVDFGGNGLLIVAGQGVDTRFEVTVDYLIDSASFALFGGQWELQAVVITPNILRCNATEVSVTNYTMTSSQVLEAASRVVDKKITFQPSDGEYAPPLWGQHGNGGSFKSFFSNVWKGIKKAGQWIGNHVGDITKGAEIAGQIFGAGAFPKRSLAYDGNSDEPATKQARF